jgi:putative ABC transport system permease protein
MYTRLSLRNMRRSLRDYVLYFTTLALIVALMYSFLSLSFSDDVKALAENISLLTNGLILFSLVVALISAFITSHAMDFILAQRKKEFATYLLMGMENRTVVRLFLGESVVIGIAAFFCGTAIGTLLSSVFAKMALNVFDVPYAYQLSLSWQSMVVSFLLFLFMYGIGLARSIAVIKRTTIIRLLYDRVRSETYTERSLRWYAVYLFCSAVILALGGILLKRVVTERSNLAMLILVLGFALILLGVYAFYRRFPELLVALMRRGKNRAYRGANLFILGELRSRVNSSGKILAVTALLLAFSLATMFLGLVTGAGYKANIQAEYPYDVTVALDTKIADFNDVLDFIDSKTPVKDYVSYYLYTDPSVPVEIMALSDYNRLREQLGLDEQILAGDQYLTHCEWALRKEVKQALAVDNSITLNGKRLVSNADLVFSEPMEQARMVGTKGRAIVVPDEVAFSLDASLSRLVVTLVDGGEAELRSELNRFVRNEWKPQVLSAPRERVTMSVTVKAWGRANSLSGFAALSFCGLYLSVVFIVLSCTVLGFEQLASLARSRRGYSIIWHLGVTDSERKKLILKDLTIFFLIPAVLPCALLLLLAAGSQKVFAAYIAQPHAIPLYTVVTLSVFAVVYGLYFAATYFIYSRSVLGTAS